MKTSKRQKFSVKKVEKMCDMNSNFCSDPFITPHRNLCFLLTRHSVLPARKPNIF